MSNAPDDIDLNGGQADGEQGGRPLSPETVETGRSPGPDTPGTAADSAATPDTGRGAVGASITMVEAAAVAPTDHSADAAKSAAVEQPSREAGLAVSQNAPQPVCDAAERVAPTNTEIPALSVIPAVSCVHDDTDMATAVGGEATPVLIPADRVRQAVERVSARDALPSDDHRFLDHVRRMVLAVAQLLNQSAQDCPELEGGVLSRAFSTAHAKLQVIMKWG